MALEAGSRGPRVIAPELQDKSKLLLLGLNLLNKSLNLPCAVVQPQTSQTRYDDSHTKLDESSVTSPLEKNRKRKRESGNEVADKREKRKMMNRVSAQNARDRKKIYLDNLEERISLLEEKNKKLEDENVLLKEHTSTLTQENVELEEKLSHQTDDLKALVKEALLQEPFWLGSAAPRQVSLQQKRFLKQLFLVQVLLAFSVKFPSLTHSIPALPQHELEFLDLTNHISLDSNHSPLLRESPWWGACQAQWNPPLN